MKWMGLALGGLLLTGCQTGPSTVMSNLPPEEPTGWRTFAEPGDGLTIAAPTTWRKSLLKSVDPLPEDAQDEANAPLFANEPSMGGPSSGASAGMNDLMGAFSSQMQDFDANMRENEFKRIEKERKSGILLRLFDTSRSQVLGETPTNFRVEKSTGGPTVLEDAVNARRSGIRMEREAMDSNWIDEAVQLPIGPAWRFHFTGRTVGGDEVERVIYLIAHRNDVYKISFISTNETGQLMPKAEAIMATFRVN